MRMVNEVAVFYLHWIQSSNFHRELHALQSISSSKFLEEFFENKLDVYVSKRHVKLGRQRDILKEKGLLCPTCLAINRINK